MLHSTAVASDSGFSFEDAVVDGLSDDPLRQLPGDSLHSILWLLWHSARTEDTAMNLVFAGRDSVLHGEGWFDRIGVAARDIGTEMDRDQVIALSRQLDVDGVRGYRTAVGKRTREIVQAADFGGLSRKVEPERIERVWREGALVEAAHGVADYWSRHPQYNLLLMPATRHSMTHLNAALRVRQALC
jgi:hypothetical protein